MKTTTFNAFKKTIEAATTEAEVKAIYEALELSDASETVACEEAYKAALAKIKDSTPKQTKVKNPAPALTLGRIVKGVNVSNSLLIKSATGEQVERINEIVPVNGFLEIMSIVTALGTDNVKRCTISGLVHYWDNEQNMYVMREYTHKQTLSEAQSWLLASANLPEQYVNTGDNVLYMQFSMEHRIHMKTSYANSESPTGFYYHSTQTVKDENGTVLPVHVNGYYSVNKFEPFPKTTAERFMKSWEADNRIYLTKRVEAAGAKQVEDAKKTAKIDAAFALNKRIEDSNADRTSIMELLSVL